MWKLRYHPDVYEDLRGLGVAERGRITKVLEERLMQGSPDRIGKPLHAPLSGWRRLRTGKWRIVYRVDGDTVTVFVLCIGIRRDDEVYSLAEGRLEPA